MRRPALFALLSVALIGGCKKEVVDLNALMEAVPNSGSRDGNNYKVFAKVLRESAGPATGFKVEAWVKGKGEHQILVTDKHGLVKFENLPFPEAKNHLNMSFHYYKGPRDQSRSIDYPFLEGDAYRMKDTQYIPDSVTPDPQ